MLFRSMDDFCDYAAKVLGEQQSEVLRRFMRALANDEKPPVGLVFAGGMGKTTVAHALRGFAERHDSEVMVVHICDDNAVDAMKAWHVRKAEICTAGVIVDAASVPRPVAGTTKISRVFQAIIDVLQESEACKPVPSELAYPSWKGFQVIQFVTVEEFDRRLDFDPESLERFWRGEHK